jgi:DnaA regulatory inactivator Hda
MARQLAFDLPARPALGRGDFFVSPANEMAVSAVERWGDWPKGMLVLTGPEGAGKTHLAHVWARLAGARILAAAELGAADLEALATGPLAVEDADAAAGAPEAEEALFHLHNLAAAAGQPVLFTAARAPRQWGLALPDLASRMEACAVAEIAPPDDALLSAVLVKLFADRQIAVPPRLVAWLVTRMPRSFAEAARAVEALDRAALSEGRAVTLPLARGVLDKFWDEA